MVKKNDKSKFFECIAGYSKIKEEALGIVDLIVNKETYIKSGARFPRGWVFDGPAGLGKTTIVKCIGLASDTEVIEVSEKACDKDTDKEQMIIKQFKLASEKERAIILIDDMDKLVGYASYRYEVPENLALQKILMHEIDKISQLGNSIIIATVNERFLVGDSVLRSGRFDRNIMFPLPTKKDRKALFSHFLNNVKIHSDVSIDELSELSAHNSCADIECIVNEAIISSVNARKDVVSHSDLAQARKRVVLGDIPRDFEVDEENEQITAYHEAGHIVMSWYTDPNVVFEASIVKQGSANGNVIRSEEKNGNMNPQILCNKILVALAGGVSAEIMTGKKQLGASRDYAMGINAIKSLMKNGYYGYDYCMLASAGRDSYSRTEFSQEFLGECEKRITAELKANDLKTREILTNHTAHITAVAKALVDKKQLSHQDIVKILENVK